MRSRATRSRRCCKLWGTGIGDDSRWITCVTARLLL
jgi:hypothetical protein